jgi:hypothetical protein
MSCAGLAFNLNGKKIIIFIEHVELISIQIKIELCL